MPSTILIAGLGLLGGSLALALKQLGGFQVRALGRNRRRLLQAQAAGMVDEAGEDPGRLVPGANLIVVSVPVDVIVHTVDSIAPWLDVDTVITDTGSSKQAVCAAVQDLSPDIASRFLGSHPMTGSEKSGLEHARADLYAGCTVAVTPTGRERPGTGEQVAQFWNALGAKTVFLDPGEHDRITALTSHLPHLVAAILGSCLQDSPAAGELFQGLYGRGLLDILRPGAASGALWWDILNSNRQAVADNSACLRRLLEQTEQQLVSGNRQHITRLFDNCGRLYSNLEKGNNTVPE